MTDASKVAIDLPRLPGESARAYDARLRYVTMGPLRSIAAVGQQLGINGASRAGHLLRWSSQYQWVESAEAYDTALAEHAIQAAAVEQLAEIAAHRQRAKQAGERLHDVAVAMLDRLEARADDLAYTPATLATIARALVVASDLEAHALQLVHVLQRAGDRSDLDITALSEAQIDRIVSASLPQVRSAGDRDAEADGLITAAAAD